MVYSFLQPSFLSSLGVVNWGYTNESRPISYKHYEKWCEADLSGGLTYLTDYRKALRKDLRAFFPEFRSALVFCFDYTNEKAAVEQWYESEANGGPKIASYALSFGGRDYHDVIGARLDRIEKEIRKAWPDISIKKTIDMHPVLERDLAYRAGIGWFGKNSMLISRGNGSFFLIGSLLLSKSLCLPPPKVVSDHCGSCTRCIDSCPTSAIQETSRTIDAGLCLSSITIEKRDRSKGAMPKVEVPEVFGCDICQDVCPWNKKPLRDAIPSKIAPLQKMILRFFTKGSAEEIRFRLMQFSKRQFQNVFAGTVFTRPGRDGLIKNYDHPERFSSES